MSNDLWFAGGGGGKGGDGGGEEEKRTHESSSAGLAGVADSNTHVCGLAS